MRIAQIAPRGEQPWSGVLTVIVNLSAALRGHGYDVEVWQLHQWRSPTYSVYRRILDTAGVIQVPVAAESPWWRIDRAVGDAIEDRHIDVVHLHGAFNVWNTILSRAFRRPYVFSPHSGYDPVSLQRSRVRKSLYAWLFERSMLQNAALCTALTEVELSQLRAFGFGGRAEVIPNGVDPPPENVDHFAFRTELGITPRTPLALFVGRLDVYRKGLDVLTRGIARAPEWHLALVGPQFRGMVQLEEMLEDPQVGERVHLVGARHGRALHEALAGADVFTLLSRWEGLPMALLEALSHGKPAIVSAAVDQLIGIEAAGAGWVADEHALPSVLMGLQRQAPDELQRRQEAAWLLARRYEWNSIAQRYGAAYERIHRSHTIARP
jgi:glycosyltransferase involved in cell wall biosynthesis